MLRGMEASEGDLLSRGYGAVLWGPDDKTVRKARITRFMSWLTVGRGLAAAVTRTFGSGRYRDPRSSGRRSGTTSRCSATGAGGPALAGEIMPDVRWFEGATLNYARNALRTAWTDPDRTAIIFDAERGRAGASATLQLAAEVARVAGGLRSLGVGRGDRVAALLPNLPEAAIGLMAARAWARSGRPARRISG